MDWSKTYRDERYHLRCVIHDTRLVVPKAPTTSFEDWRDPWCRECREEQQERQAS